ncbi:Brix-domain-containing protein [Aaosphaeria arxii CBS 175.79]|uniref:Brix-domain-containing protein n=1 Tax=Aaosphaeria arxii CBS 175.79 TaxID=1450172 RepID=A0A6A5XID4_9PLEO|nr:Brix-domain-containing protein [Aaosphaeria arxii CBS 175.79]KAF2012626.1 Brix-domain-containing protein [Aaosphaeria arxii CBS 175.79]
MAFSKSTPMPTSLKPKNKLRRQQTYLAIKKEKEAAKRDMRHKRKREEAKDSSLREERLANNQPKTIDVKRTWDEGVADEEDMLGMAVDVEQLAKRRRLEQEAPEDADEDGVLAQLKKREMEDDEDEEDEDEQDDDADSMLDSDSDAEEDDDSDSDAPPKRKAPAPKRAASPTTSTATNLELSPEFLKQKFPALFAPPVEPKILITTSINSTLHKHAEILIDLFPNSNYIRRSAHFGAPKYSVREIAQFAKNRGYTHLIIMMQALHEKKPDGLDVVHLTGDTLGPHFHFSISNWIEGKKLPGHGNSTGHIPELILNNFKTPLGHLCAQLFKSLYPPQPQFQGRTVVTMHNQRDYIFWRRHRYVFREKKGREKPVLGSDNKEILENLKTGLQELGPRFTLKLRRVDRGVQYKSGQEWQWKGKMEKQRTRFNM